ncbi:cysteine desulfurase [Patescibacteria group bacterium]|nr:cysteine desulfurase [Patescibacteria group bacterium]
MNFPNPFKINKTPNKRIFLDYASTTPIDEQVLKVMKESTSGGNFANPSALYSEALVVKEKIKEAREKIANILNCQKSEIIFTSGGTEGNNLALLGVFEACKRDDFIPHIVTTVIEHPAILEICKEIERRGGEVTYVPVSEEGIVSEKDIIKAIKDNTVLVSVMYANNEIGTIQPINQIGKLIKEYKRNKNTELPYFHTDACQAAVYLDIDVLKLRVDLLTLDGIKMYGPRSSGLLYAKTETNIFPILFGGGQEKGIRSGTENLQAIVGLAEALSLANNDRLGESQRLTSIRDYGIDVLLKKFPKAKINGSREFRLPNNINICFPSIDSEFAVISLDVCGISASYSSSCRTLKEDSSSYVVNALGKPNCANSSLRFTFGKYSNKSDVDALVEALSKIIK